MKLNDDAKAVLRDAGVSQAAWARANYMADGKWTGDPCGCPDSGRCMNGFHHFPDRFGSAMKDGRVFEIEKV